MFYTYVFRHPLSGEPVYIGKGQKQRAQSHLKTTHNERLRRFLRDYPHAKPEIVFRTSSESEALAEEQRLIALHKATVFNLAPHGIMQNGRPVLNRTAELLANPNFSVRDAKIGSRHPTKLVADTAEWLRRNKRFDAKAIQRARRRTLRKWHPDTQIPMKRA